MSESQTTIKPCEVQAGPHHWRAIFGGPFGWTELDENGCIQECSECHHRRSATWLEAAMSRTIQDLRKAALPASEGTA